MKFFVQNRSRARRRTVSGTSTSEVQRDGERDPQRVPALGPERGGHVVARRGQRPQGRAIADALIDIERVSKRFETRSGVVEAIGEVDLEVGDGGS